MLVSSVGYKCFPEQYESGKNNLILLPRPKNKIANYVIVAPLGGHIGVMRDDFWELANI